MNAARMKTLNDYRPSKTALFWSCAACIVATMIVGFAWAGWVTGGTAKEMAESAAGEARAELAAAICVDRFMEASDAKARLATLKGASTWERDDLIEKAGWVTFAKAEDPVEGAADLCAERLMKAKLPEPKQAAVSG